jgi:hypothetical protein
MLMKATAMTTLRDEEIKRIAEQVATANQIPFNAVSTTAALDSTGFPAIEVTISIVPGASSFNIFKDGRSSRTVSEVHRRLADEGEERLPIVHFEGKRAP